MMHIFFCNDKASYNITFSNWCGIDSDQDWVIDTLEDLNHNGNLYDDDTDHDGIPNFLDKDDDNDWVLTIFEDINLDWNPQNDDSDHDGIPNYLDTDDNNNGVWNLDEILKLNNISRTYRDKLMKDIWGLDTPEKFMRILEYIKYITISKDADKIPDYLQNKGTGDDKILYETLEAYKAWLDNLQTSSWVLTKYIDRITYYPGQDKYIYSDLLASGNNNKTIYEYIYKYIYGTGDGSNGTNWSSNNGTWSQTIIYIYILEILEAIMVTAEDEAEVVVTEIQIETIAELMAVAEDEVEIPLNHILNIFVVLIRLVALQ